MTLEILIVEDEIDIGCLVKDILEDDGYQVRLVHTGEQAISAVKQRCPNLILLDIWLGESRFDGIRVLKEVKKDFSEVPIIMMTGHGTIETAVKAMREGAYDFLEKPFQSERLLLLITRAFEAYNLMSENKELKSKSLEEFELIGTSSLIQNLNDTISKIAPTNSRIIISGASGTGKETIARTIHKQSSRPKGPFVSFNCLSAKSEELDKILFGFETEKDIKIGLLEKAHHGTLLLEEIGAISLEIQSKLVKFLHHGAIERTYSAKKISIDCRIIVSTTQNLLELVALKTFREDLFYRLNIVPLNVPMLNKRLEDIEPLVVHFIQYYSKINNKPLKSLTSDAITALQSYSWPGNVRQLKNVIEWIVLVHGDDASLIIDIAQLPNDLLNDAPAFMVSESMARIMQLPLREAREQFERDYLLAQVTRFSGNISQTANFVGMERSALHRKLKNLAIERPQIDEANDKTYHVS